MASVIATSKRFADCFVVRCSPGGELLTGDVCTVSRGTRILGDATVLFTRGNLAYAHAGFPANVSAGDSLSLRTRSGERPDGVYLERFLSVVRSARDEGGAEKTPSVTTPFNGLRYRSWHEYVPAGDKQLLACVVRDGLLAGVNSEGRAVRHPIWGPAIPVVDWMGTPMQVGEIPRDADVRGIFGLVGGIPRVMAVVVNQPLTERDLMAGLRGVQEDWERLFPRNPADLGERSGTARSVRPTLVRQCPGARVVALNVMAREVRVLDTLGTEHVLRVPPVVYRLSDGVALELAAFSPGQVLDLIWQEAPKGRNVLAVGPGPVWEHEVPRYHARVLRADGGARGYYRIQLPGQAWARPRDILVVWRKGMRLGEVFLVGRNPAVIFARQNVPALRAGDDLVFERRADAAYTNNERYSEPGTCRVKRIDSPKDEFDPRDL